MKLLFSVSVSEHVPSWGRPGAFHKSVAYGFGAATLEEAVARARIACLNFGVAKDRSFSFEVFRFCTCTLESHGGRVSAKCKRKCPTCGGLGILSLEGEKLPLGDLGMFGGTLRGEGRS